MWSRRHTLLSPGFARRPLCSLLLVLLLALQAGCQPSAPDAAFATYLQQLGKLLAMARPAVATTSLSQPPLPGELQLDLPVDGLDTLDFLSLSGCAVQATLLKRSSSLGQWAKPSQRLLLELEYLRLAPACIGTLRSRHKAALATLLEGSWLLRREQLPTLIFNATLGSDEYRAFWLSTPAPEQYPAVSPATAVAALAAINTLTHRWLGGDYRAHNRELELLLSEVAGGDGGVLLQALSRQNDWLASADLMLAQHMARDPLCFKRERDSAVTQLPSLTDQYSNSEIGVRAARMDRRFRQVLPHIAALEAQLSGTLPQRYRSWMDERELRFAEFASAPLQHLNRLKLARRSCAPE